MPCIAPAKPRLFVYFLCSLVCRRKDLTGGNGGVVGGGRNINGVRKREEMCFKAREELITR